MGTPLKRPAPPRLLAVDFNACRRPQQEPYRLLAERGRLQVRLLVPDAWKEAFGMAPADLSLREEGLDIRALPLRFNGRYHRVLMRGLRREVRDYRPDVVWVIAEPENFLAAQALQAVRHEAPRAALALVSWRNIHYGRGALPYKAAFLHQALEDQLRDAGAKVLAYNQDAVTLLGARGFDCEPTLMGVNLAYFSPGSRSQARQVLGLPAKAFIAGFVGRCLPEKGVGGLLEALSGIAGARLLLVGDGPAKAAWLRQAQGLGVPVDAKVLKHDEVAQAMRAMDVLCLPSLGTAAWKEQFGRVLIEAWACGTPVLGSDSGAIPEVIDAGPSPAGGFSRGQGGLVTREGDVAGLRAALRALKRPALARALGRVGLGRARSRFTWGAVAPVLERQLLAMAREGRRPRFLGLDLFGGWSADLNARMDAWMREKGRGRARMLFYLNAHLAVKAGGDEAFRAILQQADMVLPDGQGVVVALRGMGLPAAERLALGDVLPDLAAAAARARRGIFLWGAAPGVAAEAGSALQARLPGLKVLGAEHGFLDAAGESALRQRLRRLQPGLLLLGMGSPKQEELAALLAPELPRTVIAVCGNAFTFIAGRQPRAPRWMAGLGVEWVWRLALEPRRLAGRYLLGNLRFAWLALKASRAGLA